MTLYDTLADAILGPQVRPFESFVPTRGINASSGQWYGSNFASYHFDLAQLLVAHAGEGGWVLEVRQPAIDIGPSQTLCKTLLRRC